MSLINLHSHSTFSDGTLPPEKVAAAAAAAGVTYFSLTDHDNTGGWRGLGPRLSEKGLRWCSGVELSTRLHDSLHVLGYGVDPDSPALLSALEEFRRRRLRRMEEILALLRPLGFSATLADLEAAGGPPPSGGTPAARTYGRPHLADLMESRGFVKDRRQAFGKYIGYDRPAYVPPRGPDMEEAIKAIKAAGGAAVVAHPGVVEKVLDLAAWKDMGLDGIEAYYPCHTVRKMKEFREQARRYGLGVTAGTDFHGPGTGREDMSGFDHDPAEFGWLEKYWS